MAFPTTGVLYNFDGQSDGTDLTGGGRPWGLFLTLGELEHFGNRCRPSTTSTCASYYNAATYQDSEVYATVAVLPTTDTRTISLWLRVASPTLATADGYRLLYTFLTGATDTLAIQRLDDGIPTTLETITLDLAAGDAIGLEMVGSALRAYRKPAAGSWGAIGSGVTDATYTAAGYLGISGRDQVWRLDNFGGGTYVPAAVPPVNVTTPAVTGNAWVGQTLTITDGDGVEDWTGEDSIARQWQRETAVGSGTYANISAETGDTYVLVNADRTLRNRAKLTATNGSGSTDAFSNVLGPIGTATALLGLLEMQADLVGSWLAPPPEIQGGQRPHIGIGIRIGV